MKILYVENHARFASVVISQFLSTHQVSLVPSLQQAQEALASDTYDAILIDFDLDDGKGDALLPVINQLTPRPRVVAASSHDTGNEALVLAGANVVCKKSDFARINKVLDGLD